MTKTVPLSEELNLSPIEEESIILKTVLDLTFDMVNNEMIDFYGNPPFEAKIKSFSHQKLFEILLVDFLSPTKDIFKEKKSYLAFLSDICDNPELSHKPSFLKKTVTEFEKWLSEEITLKNIAVSNIGRSYDLCVSRKELIQLCGNISKHNIANLSWKINHLKRIIQKSNKDVVIHDIIITLNNLYGRFQSDWLIGQTSFLTEFLNNIRIGIFEYLTPLYEKSIEYNLINPSKYSYQFPNGISSEIGKEYFWNLMNDVRQKFYIHNFKVCDEYRKTNHNTSNVQSKTNSDE